MRTKLDDQDRDELKRLVSIGRDTAQHLLAALNSHPDHAFIGQVEEQHRTAGSARLVVLTVLLREVLPRAQLDECLAAATLSRISVMLAALCRTGVIPPRGEDFADEDIETAVKLLQHAPVHMHRQTDQQRRSIITELISSLLGDDTEETAS